MPITGLGSIRPLAGYVSGGEVTSVRVNADGMPMVDPVIAKIAPELQPLKMLFSYLRKKRSKLGKDMTFEYRVRKALPRHVVVATAYAASATTVVFQTGHGVYLQRNVAFKNLRTGDVMMPQGAVSTDTAQDVVWIGSGTPAAGEVGDVFERLAGNRLEGSAMHDAWYVATEWDYNYPNTMSVPVAMTHHAELIKRWEGGELMDQEMAEKIEVYARDEESLLIHGQRKTGTVDTTQAGRISSLGNNTAAKYWVGDGIIEQMKAKAPAEQCKSLDGNITEAYLREQIIGTWAFRAGTSDQLLGLCCKEVLQTCQDAKFDILETRPSDDKMINLDWKVFSIEGKTVTLAHHPSFDIPTAGTGHRGGLFFGMDMGEKHTPELIEIEPSHWQPAVLPNRIDGSASDLYGIWAMIMKDCTAHILVDGILGKG